MMQDGVTQFLLKHTGELPVSFHMPGHKGSRLYRKYGYGVFLDTMADCDITEIPGADNLFQMEGIIRETAEKYRQLYQVKKSYLLINGTSGGLIAAILASVPRGKKLIMARNCHKSVFNALSLGGIEPAYAYPSLVEDHGVSGPVAPEEIERCLQENPDGEAVILPSPNYYGICSDIRKIAEVVHRYGKILIVDQAHGAHLKFMPQQPPAAEECGADIIVNSIHKTLASFTQSAVLNLNSERVDPYVLEDKLQAIQSTSPSYLLMASLDINAEIVKGHGTELFGQWEENVEWFYLEAAKIPGVRIMDVPQLMDRTKINLDMSACGIDGNELEERLMEHGIFAELVTGNLLMCMTGIGNSRSDFEALLAALKSVAVVTVKRTSQESDMCLQAAGKGLREGAIQTLKGLKGDVGTYAAGAALWTKRRPLHEIPKKRELRNLTDCEGMICASSIIPYPPGIPFLCPGEEIERAEIDYIRQLRERGEKVIGVNEKNEIFVKK